MNSKMDKRSPSTPSFSNYRPQNDCIWGLRQSWNVCCDVGVFKRSGLAVHTKTASQHFHISQFRRVYLEKLRFWWSKTAFYWRRKVKRKKKISFPNLSGLVWPGSRGLLMRPKSPLLQIGLRGRNEDSVGREEGKRVRARRRKHGSPQTRVTACTWALPR